MSEGTQLTFENMSVEEICDYIVKATVDNDNIEEIPACRLVFAARELKRLRVYNIDNPEYVDKLFSEIENALNTDGFVGYGTKSRFHLALTTLKKWFSAGTEENKENETKSMELKELTFEQTVMCINKIIHDAHIEADVTERIYACMAHLRDLYEERAVENSIVEPCERGRDKGRLDLEERVERLDYLLDETADKITVNNLHNFLLRRIEQQEDRIQQLEEQIKEKATITMMHGTEDSLKDVLNDCGKRIARLENESENDKTKGAEIKDILTKLVERLQEVE